MAEDCPPEALDATVREEMEDLESIARSFDLEQISLADVKHMKQRAYSTHRSRRELVDRYRGTER